MRISRVLSLLTFRHSVPLLCLSVIDFNDLPSPHNLVQLSYPSIGAHEDFLLLVSKDADEYDPISELLRTIFTIACNFLTVVTTTGEWEWEVDLELRLGVEVEDLTVVEVEVGFDFEVVEVELMKLNYFVQE